MNFIHLNVHSHYSKGWGTGTVQEICEAARRMGMKRLALTDTNNLYGMVFFIQSAREMGIDPIVGSEILCDNHRALLLVKDRHGYANLCRIISDRHCNAAFDLVHALREKRQGLIILSDDFGLLKALKGDGLEDLYVELSPGYHMGRCYAFARDSRIPPVATNRVYLVGKDQFPIHRILRAVSLNTKLSRLAPGDTCLAQNFLNPPGEMMLQFPHAPLAIANSVRVAESCRTEWDFDRIIFPKFDGMTDEEAFDRLYRETLAGCKHRYGKIAPAVQKRIDHEMAIIREKRFAHYFLVVADITRRAPRSCGRGSAAASIVSYALGITHVDPIKHNLFFERFLNPRRMDPPDIDVDFPWDEREKIIDLVFAKYGTRRTAMVSNHNTFAARSAIRETAKVFGLTDQEIGRVTKQIGFGWKLDMTAAELSSHPRMRGVELREPWDEILRAASRIENHFHHLSTHCGGVVIVPDDIRRYCPAEISAGGLQVLHWEKDSVEESGLVKIDILGNRSLAVIRDALELVEKNEGRRIDYARLDPLHDPETVRIFYEGNTFGVFYFESPATRQVLTKVGRGFTFHDYLRTDHFHLNVVVTSIIRPASNQSIRTWVSRLRGEPWAPPHPLLMPVLEETLGVMVFQGQLSQAAIHLAGFDPGEADALRKVVSKKHKEKKLRDFCARFRTGAGKRGVPRKVIEEVWTMMMGFDGYSFCKPHSASYTLVAYKSAFLRAHYPAEFMASVISNGGGYYTTFGYLSEAKRMGLRVLPPHINLSPVKYTGKGREIRVGLMQIKALPLEAMEAVVHERGKDGPFSSLGEFLERTRPHIHLQDVRVLIKAGCFDDLPGTITRPGLLWLALRFFSRKSHSRAQTSLVKPFALSSSPALPVHQSGGGNPLSRKVLLCQEKETLGFTLSVHPVALYAGHLRGTDYARAGDLDRLVGRVITIAGWLITGKTVRTKEGEAMKFITFEDPTGVYETVFFPKVYHRFCHMLNGSRPYILKGKVEEDLGAVTVTVHRVDFLDKVPLRGNALFS
jgi:error-prone DNA polymerase